VDYIKNIKPSLSKVCIAIIALVMLTQGYARGAENLAKNNVEHYILAKQEKSDKTPGKEDRKVIVFYFHGNFRCYTCKRIEQLTVKAVTEAFSDEINKGLVELQVLNVENPQYRHFINDYQLYTRSVVVSDFRQGKQKRWKNLQKVWELVHNEEAFGKYIKQEVQEYLKGPSL